MLSRAAALAARSGEPLCPRKRLLVRVSSMEVLVKRWIFLVLGVVLAIVGAVWTLQGLDLLGQSGGMNGQRIWAIIGPLAVLGGLALVKIGVRARRS